MEYNLWKNKWRTVLARAQFAYVSTQYESSRKVQASTKIELKVHFEI